MHETKIESQHVEGCLQVLVSCLIAVLYTHIVAQGKPAGRQAVSAEGVSGREAKAWMASKESYTTCWILPRSALSFFGVS